MDDLAARIKWARKRSGQTQSDVARYFGIKRESVALWEAGSSRPDSGKLPDLAHIFGLNLDWLMTGRGDPGGDDQPSSPLAREPSTVRPALDAPPLPLRQSMPLDVPVYGTAAGSRDEGDIEFYMNGQVIQDVRRPPGLVGVKNAFAIYVTGSSMSPRFREGELVYANPDRRASIGDDVIVELHPLEGNSECPGFIKELVRRSGSRIVCKQHNPEIELEYDEQHIKTISRVYTSNELMGV